MRELSLQCTPDNPRAMRAEELASEAESDRGSPVERESRKAGKSTGRRK